MTRLRLTLAALAAAALLCSTAAQAEIVIDLTPPGDIEMTGPADTKGKVPVDTDAGGATRSSVGDSYMPDTQPTLQTRHFGAQSNLACSVAEQPGSLKVINEGLEPLPPGTRIKWQVKGSPQRGFFALIRRLEIGETLMAEGIVGEGAASGADCLARVI